MRRAIDWVKKARDVGIIYDFDVDGICSCALLILIFKKLGKEVLKFVASPRPSFDRNPALQLVKHYNDLAVLDISLSKDDIKTFKDLNVLNIDHHESGLRRSVGKIGVWKNKGKYTPTAKMVYDLGCKLFKDFEQYDWISCVGVISDFGGPKHTSFVRKVHKRYGFDTGKNDKFFGTKLGEIGNVINSVRTAGDIRKAGVAVKTLVECPSPQEFLEAKSPKIRLLYRLHDKTCNALEHELERFRDKARKKGNRVLFYLKNQNYNIRSTLSTMLSARMKETLAIAETRNTGYVHISMRSRSEDLLKILKEIKAEINVVGGGHKGAVGLNIKEEDFPIFKRVFLKLA